MEGTYIFIDAGYLSKISSHLGNGKHLKCDVNQLANTFAREQQLWNIGTFYYTAPPFQGNPPEGDEGRRKANYDKFISKIKRIPSFTVREGRCQKIDGKFHQKGVDTLITMDLMTLTSKKNKIKKIIILTCDTDFVPVLQKIRDEGIEVILYYYSDRVRNSKFSMSNHIFTVCDNKVLITKEHFEKSSKKRNFLGSK